MIWGQACLLTIHGHFCLPLRAFAFWAVTLLSLRFFLYINVLLAQCVHVSFWSHYFIILLFLRLLFRLFVTSPEYLFLLSKTVLINTFEVFCGQEPSRQRFVRREGLSVRSPQLIVYHCNTFHFSLDISLSPVKGTC